MFPAQDVTEDENQKVVEEETRQFNTGYIIQHLLCIHDATVLFMPVSNCISWYVDELPNLNCSLLVFSNNKNLVE